MNNEVDKILDKILHEAKENSIPIYELEHDNRENVVFIHDLKVIIERAKREE